MKWFLAGLGLGVTAGVLFAPARVVERRRRWTRPATGDRDTLRERREETFEAARRRVANLTNAAQERVSEAVGNALVISPGAVDPLLDFLNTATEDQLVAVKGVGPKTAQQVLAGRPYESLDGLERRASRAQIEAIREQITNEPTI